MNHPQSKREGDLRMELGEVRHIPKLRKHFKRVTARARRQHAKRVITEQCDDQLWLDVYGGW